MEYEYVFNQWRQLMEPRAGKQKTAFFFTKVLVPAYTGAKRHYHNFSHLESMFRHFDAFRDQLQNPGLVAAAIFFHDLVYEPRKHDNEERSAALAAQHLNLFSFIPIDIQVVRQFILATQKHDATVSGHPDLPWFLDFDLAILGADWETYLDYAEKIRKEYRIYPDLLYKPGRRKVLEKFLERPFIYYTATFRAQYEEQARQNLRQELSSL